MTEQKTFTVLSPYTSEPVVTEKFSTPQQVAEIVDRATEAQKSWKSVPLSDRKKLVEGFVQQIELLADDITKGIVEQVGRPVRYGGGEVAGLAERALYMKTISTSCLADRPIAEKKGFRRLVRRVPVGVIFVISAWNYPLLVTVNSVIPALLAGNAVILKASPQTPFLCTVFQKAFDAAGLPKGLFQYVHVDKEDIPAVINLPGISGVQFTGSVEGGRAVKEAAGPRFIPVGLELGGKDPAYVRADADLDYTAEQIVDGAMFNSGQSCCSIERVYVHDSIYDDFVQKCVDLAKSYVLGDPASPTTTLGPVISQASARRIRDQVAQAVEMGAKSLVPESEFPALTMDPSAPGNLIAPTILVNVDHTMSMMQEETFGPVMGIMRVKDDAEAIRLMNDSPFALTASIWSKDEEEAERLGAEVECGTLFVNRADYLDPALPWSGHKDSGLGHALGESGFDAYVKLKAIHIKLLPKDH